jgi:hypothetical protein
MDWVDMLDSSGTSFTLMKAPSPVTAVTLPFSFYVDVGT